jgi:uncharacterized protein YgiM (DUF1202 family)
MSTFARRLLTVSMVLGLGFGAASAQETPKSGEAQSSAVTADFPYEGEVTCENLNVRLAPRTDAATGVVAVLRQGEKVVALGSTGEFLIVQAPRKATAWIFAKHVKKDANGTGLVLVNDAALRTDSRSNAEKIGSMKEGDTVTIVKDHLGWYQIAAPAGVKYYVSKKYVRFSAAMPTMPKEDLTEVKEVKPGSSDVAARAKMAEARSEMEIQNKLIQDEKLGEVNLSEVMAAYKEASDLAKTEPVRNEAETEYKRISSLWVIIQGIQQGKAQADKKIADLKEEQESRRRGVEDKYEACGYVDTVGPLFYRPGAFKLMMSGKIVAFIKVKDGEEAMRLKMNSMYGRYVGVTGSVLKDPPGWPDHKVVTVETVEELKK